MKSGARKAVAALAAAVAAGCASAPPEPVTAIAAPGPVAARAAPAGLVKNADFEAVPAPGRRCPPAWGCTAHSDGTSYTFELSPEYGPRGRYLKVARVRPEPWAMVSQVLPKADLAGRRVRLSVSVQGESLEGGAGPMILLHGPAGRVLDSRSVLLPRGPGWRRASVEIDVLPGTERVVVGLLVEGGGWVGFDDVEATVLPKAGA